MRKRKQEELNPYQTFTWRKKKKKKKAHIGATTSRET